MQKSKVLNNIHIILSESKQNWNCLFTIKALTQKKTQLLSCGCQTVSIHWMVFPNTMYEVIFNSGRTIKKILHLSNIPKLNQFLAIMTKFLLDLTKRDLSTIKALFADFVLNTLTLRTGLGQNHNLQEDSKLD